METDRTDYPLASEDIASLDQPNEVLAEWWCLLNRWEWPGKIPNPEPFQPWRAKGRRRKLMDMIDDVVGGRLISRTWNKDMTDEEHDLFYRGCFEGDKEAKKQYEQWSRKRHEH